METKHTPGTWLVDEDTGIVYTITEGTDGEHREPGICHAYSRDMDYLPLEQAITNAYLIAAAPDLFIALEQALKLLDSVAFVSEPGDTDELLEKIHMALAKAKGAL